MPPPRCVRSLPRRTGAATDPPRSMATPDNRHIPGNSRPIWPINSYTCHNIGRAHAWNAGAHLEFIHLSQQQARARVGRGRAPGGTACRATRRAVREGMQERAPGSDTAVPGARSRCRASALCPPTPQAVWAHHNAWRAGRDYPRGGAGHPQRWQRRPGKGATRQRARYCGCADARLPSSLGHLGAGISRGRIEGGDNSLAHLANKFMFLPQGQARARVERGARVPGISHTCHKNRLAHA